MVFIIRLVVNNPFTLGLKTRTTFKILILFYLEQLSPGQTIERSWIPHATFLVVNVEVVAKHYPTLLHEFKFKLAQNLKIWRSVMLLELFEDGKDVFKQGKTKE